MSITIQASVNPSGLHVASSHAQSDNAAMNEAAAQSPKHRAAVSIAAVERDTGLSKDTLRVWERRYGFPTPQRDAFSERTYPHEQVEQLRVIRRLMDHGHRPGKVVGLSLARLEALSASLPPSAPPASGHADVAALGALIKGHDADALRRALSQAAARLGLAGLIAQVLAPMNAWIGDTWMRGELEIFEEHVYTESVHVVLRHALGNLPTASPGAQPRVLLSTFPQESHGLGLLMAEALLALEGCSCLSLGTQTPIDDIARAALAYHCDVVALSFTASLNPKLVVAGLLELRQKLPPSIAIWAGGACPVIHQRDIAGVCTVAGLDGIAAEVALWRKTHA
jgi:MerR family transcriptional regulator, light-induced transcriptional regulator